MNHRSYHQWATTRIRIELLPEDERLLVRAMTHHLESLPLPVRWYCIVDNKLNSLIATRKTKRYLRKHPITSQMEFNFDNVTQLFPKSSQSQRPNTPPPSDAQDD